MILLKTTLTGVSALVQHNPRLVDPDDHWTKQIANLTSKKSKMTDEDRESVKWFEFAGGLYVNSDGPFVLTASPRRAFITAATTKRQGTTLERAISPLTQAVPLDYPGPRTAEELYKREEHRYYTSVGVGSYGSKRVMRMRPMFPTWSIEVDWMLEESVMDLDDFIDFAKLSGRLVGIGDNRRNGYGRYTVTASVVEEL